MPKDDPEQQVRRQRLAKRIIEAREALNNMTQEQLAELMGMDQSAVSKWENGEAEPRPSNRRRLEKVLKLDPGELQRVLEPEAVEAASERRMERQLDRILASQQAMERGQQTLVDLLTSLAEELRQR